MANWIKTVAKVLVLPLGILLVLLALKCYTKKLAANEETQKQIEEDAMDIELDINDTARELAELMQSDLHELQNPKNCTSARKLFCTSNNGNPCGFACFTHHVLHCFMVAYWTRRTFVLETKDWNYSKDKGQKGWGTVFLPLSNTCTTVTAEEAVLWSGDHEDHQVVSVPDIFHIDPKPTFLPQSIPKKIAEKLTTFHEDPFAWFAGQFLSYLMRPNAELKKYISTKKKSMGITKPYAGIHVRRTDKLLLEAKKHSLEEYMIHVENWYQSYGKDYKVDKKRVFIATDDPSVIKEARDKYSEYEVYGDENIVQSAKPESRYSFNSLLGIVYDIFVLAESDFVVCTFSSNIGRLVYEFMQSFHTNAAKKCHSVDDPTYYFYGQIRNEVIVL